jgi:hypothetical protein
MDWQRWRFLHVGISAQGGSSLSERTMAHCRNAFDCDPLYEFDMSRGDFGFLGALKEKSDSNVIEFLNKIRVLFLISPPGGGDKLIRLLEGALARCADMAYRSVYGNCVDDASGKGCQITNTISKVARCNSDDIMAVRDELNRVCGFDVLPGR